MAITIKNGNTLYFTKDHELVRSAVSEFVKKDTECNYR